MTEVNEAQRHIGQQSFATLKDFQIWLAQDLGRFGNVRDHVEFNGHTRTQGDDSTGEVLMIRLYTDTNRYQITAIENIWGSPQGWPSCEGP